MAAAVAAMTLFTACSASAGRTSALRPAATPSPPPSPPATRPLSHPAHPAAAPPATLPEDLLYLTSDLGDVVGQGTITSLEYPGASFATASASTRELVTLAVESTSDRWTITFAAPVGQQLEVGSYETAERTPSSLDAGLDVRDNGRGCSLAFGSFTLGALAFDGDGRLASLDAAFDQACEYPDAPALHGTLTYRAPPRGG
jgi:hypothetical protein